jgi:hypothetical protein
MAGEQPRDAEPTHAIALPAADFNYRSTALGDFAQQEHVTRHA